MQNKEENGFLAGLSCGFAVLLGLIALGALLAWIS